MPADEVLVDDLFDIIHRHSAVPNVIRIDDHRRSREARLQTAGRNDLEVEQVLLALKVSKGLEHLDRAVLYARTARVTRRSFVRANEDVLLRLHRRQS